MPKTVELALVIIGIIAMAMNIIGLVRAFLANKKFLSGTNKQVVMMVLLLVVFLNVHIMLEVLNNASLYFKNDQNLSSTLNHINFMLVIVVAFCTILASYINLKMAKEHGFGS